MSLLIEVSAFFSNERIDLAQHGISGRGVLLDLVKFYTEDGRKPLPYDPWTAHSISVTDLESCARAEGVQFRQGDVLLIRVGFTKRYNESNQAEKDELQGKGALSASSTC